MTYKAQELTNMEVTRANIYKVFELEQNQSIMDSSKDKDVVLFLGNTGSGKSTLINYLVQKELIADKNDNIVLKNPNDLSAMKIGVGNVSQTLFPQFVECNQLLLYDLPGFRDTRGIVVNLVNAAFIKNIVENAKTVRFIFVIAMDEITANRGDLFKQLLKSIETLISNELLKDICGFVITKTPPNQSIDKLVKKLNQFMDDDSLTKWHNEKRLAIMKMLYNESINQDDRNNIFYMINKIKQKRMENVNICSIFTYNDGNTIKSIFIDEMQEVFSCLLKKIVDTTALNSYTLSDLVNKKNELNKLINDCRFDSSNLISILKTILRDIFNAALIEFQKTIKNEVEKINLLITSEINNKERMMTENRLKEEVSKLELANEKCQKTISSLRAEINDNQQKFEEKPKDETFKIRHTEKNQQRQDLKTKSDHKDELRKIEKKSIEETSKQQFVEKDFQNKLSIKTAEMQEKQIIEESSSIIGQIMKFCNIL